LIIAETAATFMEQQTGASKEKLIAIVEDNRGVVDVFRDVLNLAGSWRLQFFTDGQEAHACLPDLGADLILLDITLPGLDGVSLYRLLRGHHKTKDTPIIVITGSYEWELRRLGLPTGLMLRKPFAMQDLLLMIQALIGRDESGAR
jgi:two-component system, chemotaxis family, chemotaxis protein CheY